MPENIGTLAVQALSTLAISLFSAWITVRLSQKRFRSERLWDRKVLSYERVIEAFHKSKKFSLEHMIAEERGNELSKERDSELRTLAKEALEEIKRTADIGSFTISEKATAILSQYQIEWNDNEHIVSWQEHLEYDYEITNKYMRLFIAEAKRDLEK